MGILAGLTLGFIAKKVIGASAVGGAAKIGGAVTAGASMLAGVKLTTVAKVGAVALLGRHLWQNRQTNIDAGRARGIPIEPGTGGGVTSEGVYIANLRELLHRFDEARGDFQKNIGEKLGIINDIVDVLGADTDLGKQFARTQNGISTLGKGTDEGLATLHEFMAANIHASAVSSDELGTEMSNLNSRLDDLGF